MARQKFSLKNAEQVRQTTTMSQQKEIKRLYEQLYQDVTRKVGQLGNSNLQKQNLILLQMFLGYFDFLLIVLPNYAQ